MKAVRQMSEVKQAAPLIQPVLLGGDIGIYALARQFHEARGLISICVSDRPVASIRHSRIIKVYEVSSSRIPSQLNHPHHSETDSALTTTLVEIARQHQNQQLILLANHDKYVEFAAKNRNILEQAGYIVPFPGLDVIENVTEKSSFTKLCTSMDVPTPHTIVVDFAQTDKTAQQNRRDVGQKYNLEFPIVAKTASSAAYANIEFPGKKKIFYIQSDTELNQLFETLENYGFTSRFLVQELIPGDDTAMRSITMYVNSQGKVSLIGSARVLLEDHHPNMLGNPVAMITDPFPKLWEQAEKLLLSSNYRGFANFDIKVDPRNGTPYFLEVNPRIGRNSYYMSASGINPLEHLMQDVVEGRELARQESTDTILYSLVPIKLVKHYLSDPKLRREVESLVKAKKVFDPLENQVETSLIRKLCVWLQKKHHYRKFKNYYPQRTNSAF